MRLVDKYLVFRKVFICSPYAGDVERNKKNALKYCRQAIEAGFIPCAPHLYFSQFLDDSDLDERIAGCYAGLEWLRECDEVWMYGEPTPGMQEEIELAKSYRIKIIRYDVWGKKMEGTK